MQSSQIHNEPKLELSSNQSRPLQKSMVQLSGQYSPRSPQNRPSPFELAPAALRKSQISSKESAVTSSTIGNPANFNFTQVSASYQPLATRQNKKTSFLQAGTTSPALKGLLSPIKTEVRYESNPEDSLKLAKTERCALGNGQPKLASFHLQSAVQQILSQVKERHLPQLLGKLKKQIYDDLYNLRLEFQAFREETRLAIRKQEGSILEIKFLESKAANADIPAPAKRREHKEELADLQSSFFLLQGKISEIESRVAEHFELNCDQFDKLEAKVAEHELKNCFGTGGIKSSLPTVLLEYTELFRVKKEGVNHQVVVSSTVYHIDKMGFLLDSQDRYLLDRRGRQIRLEQKHLQLLEAHRLITY